eukprot:EG_transcript_43263
MASEARPRWARPIPRSVPLHIPVPPRDSPANLAGVAHDPCLFPGRRLPAAGADDPQRPVHGPARPGRLPGPPADVGCVAGSGSVCPGAASSAGLARARRR